MSNISKPNIIICFQGFFLTEKYEQFVPTDN